MALDGRARHRAWHRGPRRGGLLLQRARAVRGVPRRARLAELAELCDVRVDQEAWGELEEPAADLVAAATRDRDPVLLALGQRFLGLAYVETGRPVEAAELLEAALPVLREHEPAVVGPVGWALGNALASLGQWAGARTAFATASGAFEARERILEAGHAQWRAGNAAWEAGEPTRRPATSTTPSTRRAPRARSGCTSRRCGRGARCGPTPATSPAGSPSSTRRSRPGNGWRRETGVGEDEFDGEVLEPHVLRQGAHLLARQGQVDAAVERLARAEALVGHELELVLRAEAAIMLADDDRLEAAEPRLRSSLTELHAAALVPTRVDAAGALARALDRAGRGDEAEEVWSRYGPDA